VLTSSVLFKAFLKQVTEIAKCLGAIKSKDLNRIAKLRSPMPEGGEP
jgi:hypothetical protein